MGIFDFFKNKDDCHFDIAMKKIICKFLAVHFFCHQCIFAHEQSQQHINASLSYNSWLQENTIDTLLKNVINGKITF